MALMAQLRSIGLPDTPLAEFLVMTAAGLVLYFGLAGASYYVVFVAGRKRLHPGYVPDRPAILDAIKWAVVGTVGNIALLIPFNVMVARGKTRIYWNLSDRSVAWLAISVVAYFVLVETGIYWIHRMMHVDPLYRWFHQYHHRWRKPTSWVSQAFHPIDSFALALPFHLAAFVVPIYGWLFIAIQTSFSFWAVSVHDRVSLVRWRWFNHTDNHTLHHWFFRCNYGQFTTFWDRAMGTWRDPVALAREGEVPADVLR
jgi:lathosterol oxidase